MNLYGNVETYTPGYLLADPHGAIRGAVPVEPDHATVKRGTVLYRKASGMWAPAAAANCVTTNQLAIADQDIDTTESEEISNNVSVFFAGTFVKGKVTLASNAELTAACAVALRNEGFLIETMVDPDNDEFDNKVATE